MMHLLLAALVLQKWVLINDIHLNPFARGAPVYDQDSTPSLWRSAVREMHHVDGDASVVVLGGDFLAHHFATLARRAGAEPRAAAIAAIGGMARDLGRAFPRARFVVALGNNDDPCGDYRSDQGGTYLATLARIFAPLVDRNGAAPDFERAFERGGYYETSLPAGEHMVVLNSVFWSFLYSGSCQGRVHDPGGTELAWLRGALSHGKNVVLMHIPPGYDPYATSEVHRVFAVPFLRGAYDREVVSLFERDRSHIVFAIGAHTHRYDYRLVGGNAMIVGSSISPIYGNNPAFYELEVDPSGTLHDIVPYAYRRFAGTWEREPTFDATYGIGSITAANLVEVSQRLESDPALRARWMAAYDVWSRMRDVRPSNWRVYWCAQTDPSSHFATCASTQRRTQAVLLALAAAVAAGVGLVTFAIVRRRRALRVATDR
jgi:hypothetical protein